MPKRFGVLGGIASGKSTVVELLKSYGAVAIHGDPLVHEILNTYEIQEQLRAKWLVNADGMSTAPHLPSVKVVENGKAHRPGIAKIVFEKVEEREFLEDITWEPFRERVMHLTHAFDKPYYKAIIYDIPLWFELNARPLGLHLDQVCFVECPLEDRIRRYAKRTGKELNDAERDLLARESVQVPLKNKKFAAAGYIVDNSKDESHLTKEVETLWYKLLHPDISKYFEKDAQ